MSSFVHLHVHTEYSLLDGLSKISKLLDRAKKQNMQSLAITDHGVMYGAIKFYLKSLEAGIKPIIGVEGYQAKRNRFDKEAGIDVDPNHLLLLAKTTEGYKNLLKLVTAAHLEGYYYKPRLDWELLERYHEGIIVTSACLQGAIAQAFLNKQPEKAKAYAEKMLNLFGDDFYLELQHHAKIPEQQAVNEQVVKLSRDLGIPLVATNDVHYVDPEDAEAQDALLAVQTKKLIADRNRLSMLSSPDFYLKSSEEMTKLFPHFPDALANTLKIAEKCQVEIPIGKWILPLYPLPEGTTPESYLKQLTLDNLKHRYPSASPEIVARVNYELDVICNKSFATYFLIVQDFVNWAKREGIRVGPGRGSAAGSLVSYILRITSIDPIEHGLPFERFMNPQRPTPPDIDLDFADDRRDEVIQYVTDKYGKEKVAQIITFGTMESRAAIRDIGRVLGMPYSEPDKVAKLIPVGYSIEEALTSVFELQELYKDPHYKKLLDLAQRVAGVARHASVHAAGVVMSDKDLTEYTPLQMETRGDKIITQYDMYSLDLNVSEKAVGLLKMDFLGLRNLTILGKAIDYVKATQGKTVDISKINIEDPKVYELISSGETTGIFQLESSGMRRVARNLNPSRFSDITAMVALYRPGPMELINDFIQGKKNPTQVKYPHDDLKPVLGETYGIAVYQEQCLQIANVMAGYSLAEADNLRRAIGKKKRAIMEKEKLKFTKGAKDKGYSKEIADRVWGYIERFAGYGFNKSHAASYAMIAYQTAYMKTYYPVEFMTALLTAESGNADKITIAIEECKRMGIIIAPPDINTSQTGFSVETHNESLEKKSIRFGFSAIKNVGEAAIEAILEARQTGPFIGLTDFCTRVDGQKANKKVLESVIKVGAMDQFGKRASLLVALDKIRSEVAEEQKQSIAGQQSLFTIGKETTTTPQRIDQLPEMDELPLPEILKAEKELLGLYVSEHPMAHALKIINEQVDYKLHEVEEVARQSTIKVGGIISRVKKIVTRKGNNEMAFITIEDGTGNAEVVIFPKLFQESRDTLVEGTPVLLVVKVDEKEEQTSLVAQTLHKVTDEDTITTKGPELEIPRGTPKEILLQISGILKQHPGAESITLIIPNGGEAKRITLPYKVDYTGSIAQEINALLATNDH